MFYIIIKYPFMVLFKAFVLVYMANPINNILVITTMILQIIYSFITFAIDQFYLSPYTLFNFKSTARLNNGCNILCVFFSSIV